MGIARLQFGTGRPTPVCPPDLQARLPQPMLFTTMITSLLSTYNAVRFVFLRSIMSSVVLIVMIVVINLVVNGSFSTFDTGMDFTTFIYFVPLFYFSIIMFFMWRKVVAMSARFDASLAEANSVCAGANIHWSIEGDSSSYAAKIIMKTPLTLIIMWDDSAPVNTANAVSTANTAMIAIASGIHPAPAPQPASLNQQEQPSIVVGPGPSNPALLIPSPAPNPGPTPAIPTTAWNNGDSSKNRSESGIVKAGQAPPAYTAPPSDSHSPVYAPPPSYHE